MNLLYDISILGMGHFESESRSGIFRVVENLAKELITMPDCDVSFCSCHSMEVLLKSLAYQQSVPAFANIHFSKIDNIYFKKKTHSFRISVLRNKLQSDQDSSLTKKLLTKATIQQHRLLHKLYSYGDQQFLPLNELDNAAIYHTPFFPVSPEIRSTKVKRCFTTCYDLIPIYKPEFCHQGVVDRTVNFLNSITFDTWVLCISQSARNELLTYLGSKVDPNKVVVTELAASNQFYRSTDAQMNTLVRNRYSIPEGPYILSLCTLEPRKNIERAIQAFMQLVQQQHLHHLSLVLVGNKGFNSKQLLSNIEGNAEIKEKIIVTGYVADEDLATLYSGATMFVYPSLYEGFGLPPLEAMQCGTPVITSNTTSLPEVVGDAGIMIEPTDTDALCQAMWAVYSQSALYRQLSEKAIERAKQFSWRRCAEKTVDAYKTSLIS